MQFSVFEGVKRPNDLQQQQQQQQQQQRVFIYTMKPRNNGCQVNNKFHLLLADFCLF